MIEVALRLMLEGWMLRSGGANGADKAFEKGAGMQSETYLPEAVTGLNVGPKYVWDAKWKAAAVIAREVHPAWDQLNGFAKCCHVRNVCIILGRQLDDPVRFVLCWTRDGRTCEEEWSEKTGRTGMAIALASRRDSGL